MVDNYRQYLDNKDKASFGFYEGEISLVDIWYFLKSAWKTISITGIVGLALSIAYLAITPNRYEAIAQVSMAQIGTASNNNNVNHLGVNIEEPSLLIARLSNPTSFTPEVIAACGYEGQSNAGLALSKSIKLMVPMGVANMVELKAIGPTPQMAQECAQVVFELIRTTQSLIIAPYIEEAKIKLLDDEGRLTEARDLVAKADKSGSAIGATYLSTRDEIRFLLDEITALKNVVILSQNRATRLISPIYTSDKPIAPNKRVALVTGLLGGLFLGLLIALGQRVIAKIKGKMGSVV